MNLTVDSNRPQRLTVEWHEQVWLPVIQVRRQPRCRGAKVTRISSLRKHSGRSKLSALNMKTASSSNRRFRPGFTLVELLVVISIIAVLAAMLMPALNRVRIRALENKARIEIRQIVGAVEAYESAYGKLPCSKPAQDEATLRGGDFTYGGTILAGDGSPTYVVNPVSYANYPVATNSELVAILMDLEQFNNGVRTVNTNHVKNPRSTKFLNGTFTADAALPGVGPDGVYRDPWGNPYIVTLDLNYDDQCRDAVYGLKDVSQQNLQTGYNGLVNPEYATVPDNFRYRGKVMVWSAGADKKFSTTIPANQGVNKDNILSWQ